MRFCVNTVAKELPIILDKMRHAQERRADMGRFIHGSFGSGKSHFMSLLSMLLRDRDEDNSVSCRDVLDALENLLAEHEEMLAKYDALRSAHLFNAAFATAARGRGQG